MRWVFYSPKYLRIKCFGVEEAIRLEQRCHGVPIETGLSRPFYHAATHTVLPPFLSSPLLVPLMFSPCQHGLRHLLMQMLWSPGRCLRVEVFQGRFSFPEVAHLLGARRFIWVSAPFDGLGNPTTPDRDNVVAFFPPFLTFVWISATRPHREVGRGNPEGW